MNVKGNYDAQVYLSYEETLWEVYTSLSSSADYISESIYNSIRRYFLFSLTWNFTQPGTQTPSSGFIIEGEE